MRGSPRFTTKHGAAEASSTKLTPAQAPSLNRDVATNAAEEATATMAAETAFAEATAAEATAAEASRAAGSGGRNGSGCAEGS